MLITSPDSEARVALLAAPGERHWQLAHLSTEAPFYLVSYQVEEDGFVLTQTAVVVWMPALVPLVERVMPGKVVSLQFVARAGDALGEWTVRSVAELWTDTVGGAVLFRFSACEETVDWLLQPAPLTRGCRRLLHLPA